MQGKLEMTAVPARSESCTSLKLDCSITMRDASGEVGLFVGGVGRDADGADGAIRASKDIECSPSESANALPVVKKMHIRLDKDGRATFEDVSKNSPGGSS